MKNLFLTLFVCGMGIQVHAQFPDVDASLLKVCSLYRDESSGEGRSTCGVGTYVAYGKRHFILSAAHVSQGSLGLLVKSFKKNIQIQLRGRAADTFADLEALEVEPIPGLSPLAYWDEGEKAFLVPDSLLWTWHLLIGRSKMEGAPSPHWMHNVGWETAMLLPSSYRQMPPLKGDAFYKSYFVDERGYENRRALVPTLDPYEKAIRFSTLGGMSGAPLLTSYHGKTRPFWVKLDGVATRRHRYAPFSYFAEAQRIGSLFKNFDKNAKRSPDPHWVLNGGALYRHFADGSCEIALRLRDTGDWGSADGGDWGSADGGTDPQQAAAAAKALKSSRMIYKNQEILGWKVDRGQKKAPLYFMGSFSNLRTLREKGWEGKLATIDTLSPVTPFFASVLPTLEQHFVVQNSSGEQIEFFNNFLRIKSKQICLTLNPWGALQGKRFYPILEFQGHMLDLTELFFVEASYRRIDHNHQKNASFAELLNLFIRLKRIWVDDQYLEWDLSKATPQASDKWQLRCPGE